MVIVSYSHLYCELQYHRPLAYTLARATSFRPLLKKQWTGRNLLMLLPVPAYLQEGATPIGCHTLPALASIFASSKANLYARSSTLTTHLKPSIVSGLSSDPMALRAFPLAKSHSAENIESAYRQKWAYISNLCIEKQAVNYLYLILTIAPAVPFTIKASFLVLPFA